MRHARGVGLYGFVVKTHGNSDALSFSNAVQYAVQLAGSDFNSHILESAGSLANVKGKLKI
ncbi:hypothetical protein FACS189421_12250 [Bacteroidia bacterium]|nr:hypothetical protein FACS189421_12250 [Bacteroidia bacterium]